MFCYSNNKISDKMEILNFHDFTLMKSTVQKHYSEYQKKYQKDILERYIQKLEVYVIQYLNHKTNFV